jgi:hypothetical protein
MHPAESPAHNDRILEQLMFKPQGRITQVKNILIYNGLRWALDGHVEFFEPKQCQVSACSIHHAGNSSLSIEDADMVIFQEAVNMSLARRRTDQVCAIN